MVQINAMTISGIFQRALRAGTTFFLLITNSKGVYHEPIVNDIEAG